MRVLLVEDDKNFAKSIELMLKSAGFDVETTDEGETGLDLSKIYEYSIILLDLGLPDLDGHQVLKQIRDARVKTPVLILSGSDQIEDKLKSLGFGADDYVTKDIDRRELIARIQAIVRRSHGHSAGVVKIGDLEVNLDNRTASVGGQTVHLTTKEYAILELLVLRQGMTITKEMFINQMYNGLDEPDPKIVDVFVCRLRKKVADLTSGDNYIETVWGRGYTLKDPKEAGPKKVKA